MRMMMTMMSLTRRIRGIGWEGELKWYVEEPLSDVKKKNTLKWWSVSVISNRSIRVLTLGHVVLLDAYNKVSDPHPYST